MPSLLPATSDGYREAARKVHVGYGVSSGFEELSKVAPDTWTFMGDDSVRSVHNDSEAAQILEDTFPGSPAHLIEES